MRRRRELLISLGCLAASRVEAAGETEEQLFRRLSQWERARRARSAELAEPLRKLLQRRLDKLIAAAAFLNRGVTNAPVVEIDHRSTDPYLCFTYPADGPQPKIWFSVETSATLFKLAHAQALGDHLGFEWVHAYFMYMRRTPPRDLIVDPYRASGVVTADGKLNNSLMSEEDHRAAVKQGNQAMDSMQWFLLAHELAHVIRPSEARRPDEGDEVYFGRRRAAEALADATAFQILAALPVSDIGQRLPKGAAMLFLGWVLALQRSHRLDVANRSHPLNPSRAVAVASFVLSNLDSLGVAANERSSVIEICERTQKLMREIESDQDFFVALDQVASRQLLSGLRAPGRSR